MFKKPGLDSSTLLKKALLQVESLAILLHLSLPFPLRRIITFTAGSSDAFVHSPQLESKSGTELLQTSTDVLDTLDLPAFGVDDALLGRSLVAEDVTVSAYKDVVSLVVQGDNLSALELWPGREESLEELRREKTQRGLEVIEE